MAKAKLDTTKYNKTLQQNFVFTANQRKLAYYYA